MLAEISEQKVSQTFIQDIRRFATNSLIKCPRLVVQKMLDINVTINDVREALVDPQNTIIEVLEPGPATGYDRVVVMGNVSNCRYLTVSLICYLQPFMLVILDVGLPVQ